MIGKIIIKTNNNLIFSGLLKRGAEDIKKDIKANPDVKCSFDYDMTQDNGGTVTFTYESANEKAIKKLLTLPYPAKKFFDVANKSKLIEFETKIIP